MATEGIVTGSTHIRRFSKRQVLILLLVGVLVIGVAAWWFLAYKRPYPQKSSAYVAKTIIEGSTLVSAGKCPEAITKEESVLSRWDISRVDKLFALDVIIRCKTITKDDTKLDNYLSLAAKLSKELYGTPGSYETQKNSQSVVNETQEAYDKYHKDPPPKEGSDGTAL